MWNARKFRGRKIAALACLGAILAVPAASPAADLPPGSTVTRVEVDFRLNLNEPGDELNTPQFHTVMSPFGNLDSHFIQVTWNYREKPDFAAGGLQVQSWNGNQFVSKKDYRSDKLSVTNESIAWTQVMETNGNNLTFYLKDGRSTTWGRFGGPETSVSEQASVANLNDFDPQVIIDNSVVTYGGNRVARWLISEVRWYGTDGLLLSERTPRFVHQAGDQPGAPN